jgi:uncharacterized integral membrane protein (TIGR00698 family)
VGALPALLPGVAAAAAITAVATYLGGLAPLVGAPVFAIVLGIAAALVRPAGPALRPGLAFTSKRVLKASIVLLGFGLSMRQVVRTGTDSLPVLLGSLAVVLLLAWLVGRALRLRRDVKLLIGVGTAICGASAIAATDAVIDADEADVSYAIATVFTFNVIAVLAYPSIGHALGLSQHAFGLWAGTAINDTSSVVAAANIYGPAATSYAVIVKLTRTLAIIPICIALALWQARRAHRTGADGAPRKQVALRRVFPLFIVAFLAAVLINSAGWVPAGWHHGLAKLATWMITAALGAIGLSTRAGDVRRAGVRPILLGGLLWASVGLTSLGLELATGAL